MEDGEEGGKKEKRGKEGKKIGAFFFFPWFFLSLWKLQVYRVWHPCRLGTMGTGFDTLCSFFPFTVLFLFFFLFSFFLFVLSYVYVSVYM